MKNLFSIIAVLLGCAIIFAATAFICSLFLDGIFIIILYLIYAICFVSVIVLAVAGFIRSSKKNNNHTTEIHNENKSEIADSNKTHNIGENYNNLKDNIDSNKE